MPVNGVDEGPRVWFITGTSTGLGRAIAEAALARGERVVATAREPRAVKDLADRAPEHVRAYALDVTDPATVTAAVAAAIEEFGRIDVLVNNAGHGLVGALEELSEEEIHAVLGTNVLGAATVTRAVLPHMRARRSGHIVQMSSVGGVVGNPGHAIYATSKFALEGMSEALAGEVGPLGIRVTIVEPGPFRTDFAGRSMRFATQIADYRDTPAGAMRERFSHQDGAQPNDPAKAAQAILRAVDDDTSPLRLPLGPEAVTRIRHKLQRQLADLDSWETISLDTRYPSA
ncbi:oxidoreductase [Actinoallomurus iriomotensis]|uniref:Short-chain dehydrogenase/reductase n=1 Tax=Actinoallomurus iriomotensis TaxID=478107 RepID=A0A9W6VVR7_9ACTN|nr:oxidoreductase [Actinoallomurus iriomotensis]GLY87008.1 short-chain dehydrogenase/reductase [Actinoallomurus iriomotensis]